MQKLPFYFVQGRECVDVRSWGRYDSFFSFYNQFILFHLKSKKKNCNETIHLLPDIPTYCLYCTQMNRTMKWLKYSDLSWPIKCWTSIQRLNQKNTKIKTWFLVKPNPKSQKQNRKLSFAQNVQNQWKWNSYSSTTLNFLILTEHCGNTLKTIVCYV